MTLAEAHEVCRAIAKREAKNFYYAFRVLPPHKRDAMCAVYAFMRRADDIADDETLSIAERRRLMQEWLGAWRASKQITSNDAAAVRDAVFVAVNDTQERFGISDALLEELVQGTSMDLLETQAGVVAVTAGGSGQRVSETFQIYETFDGLYRYCYLVASVVGLVCIRVFGYTDRKAETLAEKTGIAFQLTNILRDVSEDAARARVYLPLEDLQANRVGVEDLALAVRGRRKTEAVARLLAHEAARARSYYAAAEELLPLIDRDSRAALWVMVTIYRGLLNRMEARKYDVFSRRVSVSTAAKLVILARGMAMAARNRMAA